MTSPEQLDRIGARIYASDTYPDAEADGGTLTVPEFPAYPAGRRVHAWEEDNQ
ncbi:hypothetical protein [Corynebacterium ureicelerivorans]|uniref:hypothetical protein n=1 Tax=Corynebacterium ureicelerivorans TaxID=401472 RepID=UPI002356F357|nr:hypothetical protein [Corynebacterium ureicelerivorans]